MVVSDLRMPGVDGAALLARVREIDPSAVRIVLSGQADLEMLARAAGSPTGCWPSRARSRTSSR